MPIDPFERVIRGELARFRRLAHETRRRGPDLGGKTRPDAVQLGARQEVRADGAIPRGRVGEEKSR